MLFRGRDTHRLKQVPYCVKSHGVFECAEVSGIPAFCGRENGATQNFARSCLWKRADNINCRGPCERPKVLHHGGFDFPLEHNLCLLGGIIPRFLEHYKTMNGLALEFVACPNRCDLPTAG